MIGELLISNVDLSDPGAIYAFVIDRVRGPSISHMQSRRMKVSGNVGRYFSEFLRGDGWSFLGAELNLGDVRLDLLWLGPEGRIEADEIKTGFRAVLDAQNAFRNQLEQQVRAGQLVFGSNFAGVRAVLLAKPSASFLATPATHGSLDG